jgi:protein involved in polysaccharide export with SLBB domain
MRRIALVLALALVTLAPVSHAQQQTPTITGVVRGQTATGGTTTPSSSAADTPYDSDLDPTQVQLAPKRTVPGLDDLSNGTLQSRLGTELSGPIDPDTYRVGPGDLMVLQLWGKVSRSVMLEVGPEGAILLPGAGTYSVNGRTLTEVRHEVLSRMAKEFRGVSMDLRLVRPRTFRIYLTGQVRSPGPTPISAGSRVTDALVPGLLMDNSSRRRIEVLHTDGQREIADLDLFHRTGVTQANPLLRDGDVLNVPVMTDFLYADGAVARPGRYELGPNDSLLTLFRLAGDPAPSADAERVLLIRWRQPFQAESLWFRLDQVYSRQVNPMLREGDRLYVFFIPQYHLQHEVTILGEVARPGVYPITEGQHRLSDLISAAGGFLTGADLSAIRIQRHSTSAGEKDPELERLLRLSRDQLTSSEYEVLRTKLANLRDEYRVDWNRLQAQKDQLDVLLKDGDVVRVERLVSSVRVDGEVTRPGFIRFEEGQGVEEYVREAGGYTNRAWKSKVRVSRAVTGQTLQAKDVKALDPGDLVWVPEQSDRGVWYHTTVILTVLAQLATVVIAVSTIHP